MSDQNNSGGSGGAGGSGGNAAPEFVQTIPEAYRGSEWAKQNAKDPDTFFKWVDNLNTSFGKRGPAMPGENATSDEIKAFNKWVGVPDKPEEYEFKNLDELKDAKRNPEVELGVKKLMLEAGIPKAAAAKLQAGYEKMLLGMHQKTLAENKALDVAFDKDIKAVFGDKKDEVLANAKRFLTDHVPESVKARLDKLDNDSLIVLTSALDGIVKKYVKEDGFVGGAGAGGGGADTMDSLSAQQRVLMATEAFRDHRHADHQKIHDQNKIIMDKMRALNKK